MPAAMKMVVPALACCVLAACASPHPVNRYRDLASASLLMATAAGDTGRVPFRYSADQADWPSYVRVLFEPVVIYAGADHQFGTTSAADRAAIADYMQTQLGQALKGHYELVSIPGPGTLRIRVTLTGIQASTPVISTLSKIAPMGLAVNSVQSIRGKQAAFTGSVSYAVEIYDSESNQLLRAYITKQYPVAENVASSLGTLEASEAGVRSGAKALLGQLH